MCRITLQEQEGITGFLNSSDSIIIYSVCAAFRRLANVLNVAENLSMHATCKRSCTFISTMMYILMFLF